MSIDADQLRISLEENRKDADKHLLKSLTLQAADLRKAPESELEALEADLEKFSRAYASEINAFADQRLVQQRFSLIAGQLAKVNDEFRTREWNRSHELAIENFRVDKRSLKFAIVSSWISAVGLVIAAVALALQIGCK